MWHPNITGHAEGLETISSTNPMAKVGPAEKKQKGKLRSGPTNSNNQRRAGTRFSNNPNLQVQSHIPPQSSPVPGVAAGSIPISASNSLGIGSVNSSSVNSIGVPGNIVVAPPISQPSQAQTVSYRNTKKIPIDRSKFHPSISNLAGAIIGVSGSNQKWMEQESGAQVQILGTTGNDPEGLHILVRYNEPRELEIVEAIIEEIGRATFEGGGGFISHILPNRKPVSPTLAGLQGNMVLSAGLQDHTSVMEKQMVGNGVAMGGMQPLPPNYSSSQPIYNNMSGNIGMGFVPRGGILTPVQIEWPKTPPASPVEFEWLLHLVLHSALSQLGPMVSHGVPMIHIPMLYDSFTSFRFEHDATSFFQSYIIQNGLLGLIQALPHIFIEGPHTIIDSSNIPKLSPIFKVNLSSGVTPLLLPAQSVTVSFVDFKLAAEAFWKMGALPPTFSGFGPQAPQNINGTGGPSGVTGTGSTVAISDHIYNTSSIVSPNQHPRQHQGKDSSGSSAGENDAAGGASILGANKIKKDQGANCILNTNSSQPTKGSPLISDDDDIYGVDNSNSKNGANSNGISSITLSSHSSTTTTSSGTTSIASVGKDNIPQTSLMIVLQGVHFLLRRWISKRLAPHYIPKSSLDFLPLDILESEFSQFYEIPLNIEILGWTNLLHFVEAFPDVWTVENVGPDEFTLIPLPYPDFSMIAKTRGITKLSNERPYDSKPDSNAFALSSQGSSLANIHKSGGSLDNIQTIVKQTQDFVTEAIASGYPANSLEINSINEIINGVTIGLYSLDNNTSSSLYELVTKVTSLLPKYSSNPVSSTSANLHSKSIGGGISKSRFDNAYKGSNSMGIMNGLAKGIKPGGFQPQPQSLQSSLSYASGHISVANEKSILGGSGHHHSSTATTAGISRFNSMNNAKNEIRYDIGASQSISTHNQHNIHHHVPHQTNAQVPNSNLSTGRSVNGGQSKRVFSNQCTVAGNNNCNLGAGKGPKQLATGQDQRSYPLYEQGNNSSSEFVNLQHNTNHVNSTQNTFGMQETGGNNIQSYYHHPMDGNSHFSSYNGAVSGVSNSMTASCHYDYHSFGVQPGNSTFIQPSQSHSVNSTHFSKSIGIPPGQTIGNNGNNANNIMLSLSNSAGVVSNRSGWDRKNKSKNN
ncbi:KH domain-containing [Cryptosporidium sp. chipmunk genotype I]|uniref:KH domain-containing n=1 Tax=Cryptosporidium sp. chipmunk genotype I TaxID=1280935 RepID=UPI00351AAAD9|nr:KH domain-containing [Cryptosporidium sp. chipmunk genotype I]